jgi:hypothetical protein
MDLEDDGGQRWSVWPQPPWPLGLLRAAWTRWQPNLESATKQPNCTEAPRNLSKRKPDWSKQYSGDRRAKKPQPQCLICNKFHSGECWNKNKTNGNGKQQGQATKPFNNRTYNKPPQQLTYSIAEMQIISDAFKGMNANHKSGKRKISSKGVDNVSSDDEACRMLCSMSLQHMNSQVSSDNTNSDNKLTDYCCYSVYDDLQDKIVKKPKKEHYTTDILVEVNFTSG